MSIIVRGPAAKQFRNPCLQPHFYGQRPVAGRCAKTAEDSPYLQGLVCLPGQSPHFLLADNFPTYRSIHSFHGQAGGAVFTAALSPLAITPDAQVNYSLEIDDYKPYQLTLSHPSLSRWNLATAQHWQIAPDGAIWGGLFYGFVKKPGAQSSTPEFIMARNYTLLRHNGERWEIPTATIISGAQQQDYFITAKGCGIPFNGENPEQKGFLDAGRAVNMYWVSREFARIKSSAYPERVWQFNGFEDPGKSLALRTGLPSTLRGDALCWGDPSAEPFQMRNTPEELVYGHLRAALECLKIKRYQTDDHFQNLVESWAPASDGSIDVALVGCDLADISLEWQNSNIFRMPYLALNRLVGEERFRNALASATKRLTDDREISGFLHANLEQLALAKNISHYSSRILELLAQLP
ncbi:MAG: hypothetical protein WCV91_04900 [Candidatus Margulisiibacteriota bacterium]